MSMLIAALGGLGLAFGKLGAGRKAASSGGGGTPIPGTPTYYIYGF